MKPFDLEKALAGEPVQLRDGRKAMFIGKIPDGILLEGNGDAVEAEYPVIGIIFNKDGAVSYKGWWAKEGYFLSREHERDVDAVGMWEESLETTIRKAYKENLPLRTRSGEKVYIVQISESDNPLIRGLPVFGVMSDIASHRWGLEGNYLDNDKQSPYDLVGLWEEEEN